MIIHVHAGIAKSLCFCACQCMVTFHTVSEPHMHACIFLVSWVFPWNAWMRYAIIICEKVMHINLDINTSSCTWNLCCSYSSILPRINISWLNSFLVRHSCHERWLPSHWAIWFPRSAAATDWGSRVASTITHSLLALTLLLILTAEDLLHYTIRYAPSH